MFLVCLTSALGVWQVHRLAWKRTILARIDTAERSPPVALPPAPAPFKKVLVRGRLDPGHAIAYEDDVRDDVHGNAVMGTYLVEPLLRVGQPPILVDLGWVKYPPRPVAGEVSVTGYIRPAEHRSWLSAADDPRGRRFYTLDPVRIAAGIGLQAPAPFTLVALGVALGVAPGVAPGDGAPNGGPDPARTLPRPPNDHLQYAITWFSLSLVAAVMFLVWARGALRR